MPQQARLSDPNISPEEILSVATAHRVGREGGWLFEDDLRDLGMNPSLDLLCLAEPQINKFRLPALVAHAEWIEAKAAKEYIQGVRRHSGWALVQGDLFLRHTWTTKGEELSNWAQFLWAAKDKLAGVFSDLERNAPYSLPTHDPLSQMVCFALMAKAGEQTSDFLWNAVQSVMIASKAPAPTRFASPSGFVNVDEVKLSQVQDATRLFGLLTQASLHEFLIDAGLLLAFLGGMSIDPSGGRAPCPR